MEISMTPTNRYHADITFHLRLMVESTDLGAAHEAAKRAALRRPGVRPEHVASISVTQMSPVEQLEVANRNAWQEQLALRDRGSSDQRARWCSYLLPEDEILNIAREELFRPFGLLTKRRQMVFADIGHPKDVRGIWTCLKVPIGGPQVTRTLADLVDWKTSPNPPLTGGEHRTLLRIQAATAEVGRHPWMRGSSNEAVSVEVREHTGTCKKCQKSTFERSALVTVQWAGRNLSREYVL
jgi:hypothetical protein